MKIALVGSATYKNLDAVRRYVRALDRGTMVLLPGGVGVSQAAYEELLAIKPRVAYSLNPPRSPGVADRIDQTAKIIESCDSLVAFWDGTDEITKRFIDLAQKAGKLAKVYRPSGQ